jgi:hypothetical protein
MYFDQDPLIIINENVLKGLFNDYLLFFMIA